MYQGKFDAKGRGQQAPEETLSSILQERNTAKENAQKAAQAARRPQPSQQAKRPPMPTRQSAARPQMERQPIAETPAPVAAKRKGPRVGGVIFYTLYFLLIFVFFVGMFFVLQWLHGWLGDYEAAQPTLKCQEVFDQLFSSPDWAQLYAQAGVEDTQFEGVEQYVAYMQEKTQGKTLDFAETSAGLYQGKKYLVRLDGEKIAAFLLDGKAETLTDIPDWNLGGVELFFTRQQSYQIQKLDGHKSYVNGQELSDDYTIQIVSTSADEYLPVGTSGPKICTQRITDLLVKPEVTITDANGTPMEVVYDEATGTFAEQTVSNVITEEETNLVLGALKARAEFMINAAGARAAVAKYFDGSSQIYADILKMSSELWMNTDRGHKFENEQVTNFQRYSDDLFSAYGSIKMVATLKDGGVRDYDIGSTLFFRKKDGKWVCFDLTNEDVTRPVGRVRLTFMNGDALLTSEFYETDCKQLQTPVVSVPEGKVFSGWVREDMNAEGNKTLTVVFTPDETGLVNMTPGVSLQPMTLYALFEDAPAEGGENG